MKLAISAPALAVLAVLAVLTLAQPVLSQPVRTQRPEDSNAVTLQAALEATLRHSTQLRLGERQMQIGLGALLTARAPFDARVTTSLSTMRENSIAPNATGAPTSVLSSTITYAAAVPKQLRSGILINPQVGLTRLDVANVAGALTSRASVSLDVLVPLLRDRGGAVTAAPERSAERGYEASILDARHAAATSILGAVTAYWNELAAEQRLEVYCSSERRAQQLVDDTRKLVEADERPAAELKQLLANLALKRAARITGEQASVEARQQLALAMGVYAGGEPALPRAITHFPDIVADEGGSSPADTVSGGWADSAAVSRADTDAIAEALRRRADLAALGARRAAAELQVAAERSDMRPRLDLAVGLSYEGLAADGGVDGALASFYRNIPGLNASVQLSYELPIARRAARGALMQNNAAYDQARIREAELVRQISSGVFVAGEALHHSRLALQASREAVTLSRQAVENEKRKFQLGMSTLFDVILAEDALTSARLAEIAGQHDYAIAIARLRYESGAILGIDLSRTEVSAGSITTPP